MKRCIYLTSIPILWHGSLIVLYENNSYENHIGANASCLVVEGVTVTWRITHIVSPIEDGVPVSQATRTVLFTC